VLINLLKGFAAKQQVKTKKEKRKKKNKERNVFLALFDYSFASQQFVFSGRETS
jgi:hypothetical protein